MEPIIFILIISILGPIIGSLIGVIKKPSKLFMYNMLSFAAGVMLAISFLELIPESIEFSSPLLCVAGVLIGALVMYVLDKVIPHIHPELCNPEPGFQLKKTALYLLIGIFLHNFPEGMAIAVGTISDIKVSLAIALGIAIHNIPEGICTSAPYYASSGKRLKAFLLSASTAIPLLAGFFVAKFLYEVISSNFIGIIIAATAGLMIYISADELIPCSCCKVTHHSTIFSLIAGVVFVVLLGMI
ncbi:ZIP family metal transporter [Candidatus Woesearchaeota archaeon]|jgi:zinc transporter, ZIP family|nr:ZIP family metal transporter [Candidatus Woesearchaeota archaeon]